MKPYTHKVNYYETDKMGITHHSNYIRWMEEARIDFLESIGFGYDKLEAVAAGKTRHCFLSANGRPVSLKREYPALDETLKKLLKK